MASSWAIDTRSTALARRVHRAPCGGVGSCANGRACGTARARHCGAMSSRETQGSTRVRVQQTYPLDQVPAAFARFAAGTRGKLVITTT